MIKYRSDLYQLLPEKAHIVEIGCAEGYFSSDILKWPVTDKLYLVDNWATIPNQFGDGASDQGWHDKNYSAAIMRVNFAIEKVKVLRGISWDMAKNVEDESIDLVYIDACHSYECVKKDIAAWWPKLKYKGIMAFHDYENNSYGVKQAVQEHARKTYPGLMQMNYGVQLLSENKLEDAGAYLNK
jgi:hypothetical protein